MRLFIALSLLVLPLLPASAGPQLDALNIMKDEYPRAFYFRRPEGLAARSQGTYEAWEQTFLSLDGIIGKCLDEELPGRSRRNIDFFTRYKHRNLEKLVLLHFNGNSRDPRFETGGYFAGHWLYFNGCGLRRDAKADSSVLHVTDPALFSTRVGRLQGNRTDDIGICRLDADGRPDWSVAEQVSLLSVDKAAGTITVRRGMLGTKPRQWPAGQTYVAAHVMEGPWGAKSNMLWSYNYATASPKDGEGKQCADRLADDFARWFGEGGPLAAFDGVEFDVLSRRPHGGNRFRGIDTDADGRRDEGVVNGRHTYEAGVLRFLALLRARLGEDRLILADGHGELNQRAVPYLNGIESEGWPSLHDEVIGDWSGGLNRHDFWRANARKPAFSYINHKFLRGGSMVEVPLNITRLVMAGALMTDSAFTFALWPENNARVWDELVMGEEQRPRWLGKPLGAPRALALETPDLWGGRNLPAEWVTDAKTGHVSLKLPRVEPGTRDLTVCCTFRGAPLPEFGSGVPRLAHLRAMLSGQLIVPALPAFATALRGGEEQAPVDPDSLVRYWPSQDLGGERHEAYFTHPPYGPRGTGYLVWERTVEVPSEKPALFFYTGLRKAPNPSDGVVFRIEVRSGEETTEVFNTHHTDFAWKAHEVALTPWAGQEVTLRFITDCGPADNPGSDHAFWGDIFLATDGRRPQRPGETPGTLMTWVNDRPFTSRFYFRDIGPGPVDLLLEVEGDGPVHLDALSAHAATDAMVREFEHGVVLANPARQPYTFALESLFPGVPFRRLRGAQDRVVNNGARVGTTVTLPPRDALFLVKAAPPGA